MALFGVLLPPLVLTLQYFENRPGGVESAEVHATVKWGATPSPHVQKLFPSATNVAWP